MAKRGKRRAWAPAGVGGLVGSSFLPGEAIKSVVGGQWSVVNLTGSKALILSWSLNGTAEAVPRYESHAAPFGVLRLAQARDGSRALRKILVRESFGPVAVLLSRCRAGVWFTATDH